MQYHVSELSKIQIDIRPGDIIFLKGNLGSGKTTLVQEILSRHGIDRGQIKSPTYTYFQSYTNPETQNSYYHFDLYRIEDYSIFVNIWAEEYLLDTQAIKLIEWPEIIEKTFAGDVEIELSETEDPNTRDIRIFYRDSARESTSLEA